MQVHYPLFAILGQFKHFLNPFSSRYSRLCAGYIDFPSSAMFSFACQKRTRKAPLFRGAGTGKGLLAPFRPQRGCRNGKKLAASLNAFFSFLRFTALPMVLRFSKLYEKRANVPHGTLALSPHLCAAAVGMRTVYSMYPSRSSRCAVAGTPLSVIRRMAWSMVFTKMRTSFTIEMR